jgi:hypothetical protein
MTGTHTRSLLGRGSMQTGPGWTACGNRQLGNPDNNDLGNVLRYRTGSLWINSWLYCDPGVLYGLNTTHNC